MVFIIRRVMVDPSHEKDKGHGQDQHDRQEIEDVVKRHHGCFPDNLLVYRCKPSLAGKSRFHASLLQGLRGPIAAQGIWHIKWGEVVDKTRLMELGPPRQDRCGNGNTEAPPDISHEIKDRCGISHLLFLHA